MGGLVAPAPVGRLATVRRDGRPHVVPICFVIIDGVVYSAVDHKPKRHQHLQRVSSITATGPRVCWSTSTTTTGPDSGGSDSMARLASSTTQPRPSGRSVR
jgi:hypothetical protein